MAGRSAAAGQTFVIMLDRWEAYMPPNDPASEILAADAAT
jgi:hypothetical protein